MLMKMRKSVTKIFVGILFGLLILSFSVWGIGDIFRTGGRSVEVAEVGNVTIDQLEFGRTLGREMNNLRQRFGGQFDMAQAQALGVVDQVLERMIRLALFQQQAADMGMVVSEDQVQKRILEEPAFRNHLGDFERARFAQVLQRSNVSEQQYIANLNRDVNRQQIIDAVIGAAQAPRPLAEALYAYQQERRVAEIVMIGKDSLPALPDPTDEDLESVHQDYSDRFKAPEYRSVTAIQLDAEALAKEVSATEEELRADFEARREEFKVAERRGIEQMVLAEEPTALAAKALLDDGVGFAEVSRSTLAREPADLGLVTREDLTQQLPELAEAAFGLAEGAVSAPVQSPFGWHLLRVTKIEPGREPDFEAVREELAHDLAMRSAVDEMVSLANELDDELGSGATLEEAAEVLKLELRRIPAIDIAGKDPDGREIPDLPPAGEFARAVFQTEIGQDGLLTETRDGNYFVARVDGVTPAAVRSLGEVRAQVADLWRNLEEDKLTRERAEALQQRIEAGEDVAAIAKSERLQHRVTGPITRQQTEIEGLASRDLAAKVFELDRGGVAMAAATDVYVVAKLVEIKPADLSADPDGLAALQDNLADALQGDLLSGFMAQLRRELGIEVNERVVQETAANL